MMDKSFKYFSVGIIALLAMLISKNVFAAELGFKLLDSRDDGQTAIIEVRVNPEPKLLNAVEGVIKFRGPITGNLTVETETGGSLLSIWPVPPKYLSSENAIHFVGGVPGGFGREGVLFRLRIASSLSGKETVSLENGAAYLNDGKGTQDKVDSNPFSFSLVSNEKGLGTSTNDHTPPVFDSPDVGRDPSVYQGKYFISFHATDDRSGVAKYEVKEGKSVTEVTNGAYVFKDQDRKTPITITAYDQAGNSRSIVINPQAGGINYVIIILLVFVLIIMIWCGKKYFKN